MQTATLSSQPTLNIQQQVDMALHALEKKVEQIHDQVSTTVTKTKDKVLESTKGITGFMGRIKNKIMKVVDWPFKKTVEGMMKTLHALGLTSQEKSIVDDSVYDKYIPVLRNSFLFAALAAPGALLTNPQAIQFILAIISSVTGVAWFTVSLKEVKEKFVDFGVELTGNMLEAFLTTIFIIAIMSGVAIASEPIQMILSWAAENGFNLLAVTSSVKFKVAAAIGTLWSGFRIVKNLVKATIKFDANDAMLTGSADAARNFYESSISELRNNAKLLKSETTTAGANMRIYESVKGYADYLNKVGLGFGAYDRLEKDIRILLDNIDADQSTFDQLSLPIIERLIIPMEETSSVKNSTFELKFGRIKQEVKKLKSLYQAGKPVSREISDNVFSNAFEGLADLVANFQDELEQNPNMKKQT
jgi:hypothetical protein